MTHAGGSAVRVGIREHRPRRGVRQRALFGSPKCGELGIGSGGPANRAGAAIGSRGPSLSPESRSYERHVPMCIEGVRGPGPHVVPLRDALIPATAMAPS